MSSSPIDVTIPVTIHSNGSIGVPTPFSVPDVNQDTMVTISWQPTGGTIDAITWNSTEGNPPAIPTKQPDGTWSVSYHAPTAPVAWNYTISGTPSGGVGVHRHDPEIDNINP